MPEAGQRALDEMEKESIRTAVSLLWLCSGWQCRTNVAAVEANWDQISGEIRSTNRCIWTGTHCGIMAPVQNLQ